MKHVLAKVTSVRALPKHRLALVFDDGAEGIFDCSGELWGEVFEPLKDPKFFAKVYLDHGAPTWPNGADLDPGRLRTEIGSPSRKIRLPASKTRFKGKPHAVAEDAAPYRSDPRN
ncbi:MAG: DUF2442 domain-containing protein [Verrucomicrobiota bacterium]